MRVCCGKGGYKATPISCERGWSSLCYGSQPCAHPSFVGQGWLHCHPLPQQIGVGVWPSSPREDEVTAESPSPKTEWWLCCHPLPTDTPMAMPLPQQRGGRYSRPSLNMMYIFNLISLKFQGMKMISWFQSSDM